MTNPAVFAPGFSMKDLFPLTTRTIELHGMTVGAVGAGTPFEVNGTPGYKMDLPVASGILFSAADVVSGIPEPSSFAFIIIGVGALGTHRYLRRRRTV